MSKKKIFALSGSASHPSSNSSLLKYFEHTLLEDFDFDHYDGLIDLPLFSPVREPNELVKDFLERLNNADVLFISSPEYIHAIPAVLKNALEWIVGDERFYQKKVAFIIASTSDGQYAKESLYEILKTMSADLSTGYFESLPNIKSVITGESAHQNPILDKLTHKFKESFT